MTNNKTDKPVYKLFLALLLWSILAGAFGCTPEDMPANKPKINVMEDTRYCQHP